MAQYHERYKLEIVDPESSETLLTVYTQDAPGADPKNYLFLPSLPVRRADIFDGTASISELRLRILDKRQLDGDQGTGWFTGELGATWQATGAYYNRLLRKTAILSRSVNGGDYSVVYTGIVASTRLVSPVTYEVQLKDNRSEEIDSKIFTAEYSAYDDTRAYSLDAVVFHRYSHIHGAQWFDWMGVEGIGKADAVEEYWVECTGESLVGGGARWSIAGGEYWAGGSPIFSAGSNVSWGGRAQIIVARPDGSGGWIFSDPITYGAGYRVSGIAYIDTFDNVPQAFLGSGRRLIVRAAGVQISDELPLHIGVPDGIHPITLLKQIISGQHGGPDLSDRYDMTALDRLEQNRDPVTNQPLSAPFPLLSFRITEPQDRIAWIEDNLIRPFGLWPVLLPDGRISFRSILSLSLDYDEFPDTVLGPDLITGAAYSQDLAGALNEVTYKIKRFVSGSSNADGLTSVEDRVTFLAESVEEIGAQAKQEISIEGYVHPSTPGAEQPIDDLQPFAQRKFDLLQWGPYVAELSTLKYGQSGVNPVQLREGDAVQLDIPSLPSLADGRRGLYARAIVSEVSERRDGVDIKAIVWSEDLRDALKIDEFKHHDGTTLYLATDWSAVQGMSGLEYEIALVARGGDYSNAWQGVRGISQSDDFTFDVADHLAQATPAWSPGQEIWLRARARDGARRSRWVVADHPVYYLKAPIDVDLQITGNADLTGTVTVDWSSNEDSLTPRGHAVKTRVWYARTPTLQAPSEWELIGIYDRVPNNPVVCDASLPDGHTAWVKVEHITTQGEDRASAGTQVAKRFVVPEAPEIDAFVHHAGDQVDLLTTWNVAADAMEVEIQVVASGAQPDWTGLNTQVVNTDDVTLFVSGWNPGEDVWARARLLRQGNPVTDWVVSRWVLADHPVYYLKAPIDVDLQITGNADLTGTVAVDWSSNEDSLTPRGHAVKTRVWYAKTPTLQAPSGWELIGIYNRVPDSPVVCDASLPDGYTAWVKLEHITTQGEDRASTGVQVSERFVISEAPEIDVFAHYAGDQVNLLTTWNVAADAMEVEIQVVASGAQPIWTGLNTQVVNTDDVTLFVSGWNPGEDVWARVRLLRQGSPVTHWAVSKHPVRYLRAPNTLELTQEVVGIVTSVYASWLSPEDVATPRGHSVKTIVEYAVSQSAVIPAIWHELGWYDRIDGHIHVTDANSGDYVHVRVWHATEEGEDHPSEPAYGFIDIP